MLSREQNYKGWPNIITEIKVHPSPSERQNVWFKKEYTLFDYMTDEPIFPVNKKRKPVYQIYFSSNEDPRPYYGEFTPEQLEGLTYYKFKNRENCMKFCDSKWHISPGTLRIVPDSNNFSK